MKRIISVSRRTDIPAFYGDWFMRRLQKGFTGVVRWHGHLPEGTPYGAARDHGLKGRAIGTKYIVPLRPQDVICFVFWSKNFAHFINNLRIIEDLGYKFYFNYTITALPALFENDVDKQAAIEALKQLSRMYSPAHINWRFDPIILSNAYGRDFYDGAFEKLASEFAGYVERCYFSFVTQYNKVKRNFQELEKTKELGIKDCSEDYKVELANDLAAVAARYKIRMFSCCGDYLVNDNIKKAHCIDGGIIESLFFPNGLRYTDKSTRKECGCTASTDIGTYDTCPHGCVYCYANMNKQQARKSFDSHDKESAFLGYSKFQSDKWLDEIKLSRSKNNVFF